MSRWYIIHAYSGFENKVRDSIISEAERMGLSEGVEQVEVPFETITEVKRGKKVQTERKTMPGYVLAKLNLNDDVYHLVKNTPKVTGFLGPRSPSAKSISSTRSGTRSRCSTGPSPASTAWSRNSISTRTRSRYRFRSLAVRPRSSWTSNRSNWSSKLLEFRALFH